MKVIEKAMSYFAACIGLSVAEGHQSLESSDVVPADDIAVGEKTNEFIMVYGNEKVCVTFTAISRKEK